MLKFTPMPREPSAEAPGSKTRLDSMPENRESLTHGTSCRRVQDNGSDATMMEDIQARIEKMKVRLDEMRGYL